MGMKPKIDPSPDFARFKDTLLLKQRWKRPPLFDFLVDPGHKARLLGRPIETPADEVEFYVAAGYDYVQGYLGHMPLEMQQVNAARRDSGAQSHGYGGIISDLDQFRSHRWSWQDLADGDMSGFADMLDRAERTAAAMPDGMKLLLWTNDAFTFAWEMIGFDEFCIASVEQPEFLAEVMDSLGRVNINIVQATIERLGDAVGAVIYSDDIAYTEGLMLGPGFFRERLFPIIQRIGDLAATVDAPLIYHSDGRLYDVFNDLAACGVRAVQPLEPKSMDPLEIKHRWPGRFCLLGNIDLDLMARGTPDAVEAHVRSKIDRLNAGGGYMPGVSNTVPDYVNFDNYIRMIETVHSYPNEACEL